MWQVVTHTTNYYALLQTTLKECLEIQIHVVILPLLLLWPELSLKVWSTVFLPLPRHLPLHPPPILDLSPGSIAITSPTELLIPTSKFSYSWVLLRWSAPAGLLVSFWQINKIHFQILMLFLEQIHMRSQCSLLIDQLCLGHYRLAEPLLTFPQLHPDIIQDHNIFNNSYSFCTMEEKYFCITAEDLLVSFLNSLYLNNQNRELQWGKGQLTTYTNRNVMAISMYRFKFPPP